MNYMTKKDIMSRLREHYEIASKDDRGEIFGIFLQGSQNYIDELFFENSDVDSRAIYLPKLRDVCLGIDISAPELILENTEHIDRFDVRKFMTLLLTPGINNYENLFTEYYIINPKYEIFYEAIKAISEDLVRVNVKKFVMATMGLSKRDLIDLKSRTGGEDYDISTLGYSRKRLSNILRFNKTVKAYLDGKPFGECLKALDEKEIYKIRRTEYYTFDEAIRLAEETFEETRKLAYDYEHIDGGDTEPIEKLKDIFVELIKDSFEF